ncbi:hypothetical protein [Cellulosimicrobium composti]|uniref:hypothetical protein n=1 Tax=Cellulosimicrobium composti TaxID=2672572 RepID=UPI0037AE578F
MTAATFAPGTRVRRTDNGRTGTVDYTAVETDLLVEYPDMVPVAYDGDDAWLTAASVLRPMPSTTVRRASMTSSDAIETERRGQVLALCENCGATREVSRRAIRDVRPLRCANCKSTTRHWRVGVRDD